MHVDYQTGRPISADQFIALLNETTLGPRRPTDDRACIEGILAHADLLVTAWIGERLVGVARSVTDFCYCCYLSDLAVSEHIQAQGIGKQLIEHTFAALKPGCKLILLAAPQAVEYYPKIGFTQHQSAWVMSSAQELK
ncbi:GNAT family N-acetyltransferase [Vibrio furnissii]|uniref:GNAT family N-acetyltransferase n=1 Tax=Vibrio furnissii TaxID=29494 RepID=UPI0025746530|nr:GNAT family N-acetyltransferase [Vibrio furnissii]WJG24010.1 GNAT family N-acetyltransferase [Vibrio furnissii]